jgi:hypothetical protein
LPSDRAHGTGAHHAGHARGGAGLGVLRGGARLAADRAARQHRPAAWLAIAPGVELHLVEDPEFEPSRFEREFGRHIAVAFSPAEFPALQERLIAHGATLIDPIRDTPFRRFFFRDPDGYVFEVVEEDHDEPRPVA